MYPIVVTCRKRKEQGFDGSDIISKFSNCFEYYDAEMRGTVEGHIRALRMGFNSGEEWVLMMQDDILFAHDFERKALARLEEAAKFNPKMRVIQFYHYSDGGEKSLGVRWYKLKGRSFMWDQAVAYRFDFLRSYLRWIDDGGHESGYVTTSGRLDSKMGHDALVGLYLKETKEDYWITCPHLVQHNIEMQSTLGTGKAPFGRFRDSKLFDAEGD